MTLVGPMLLALGCSAPEGASAAGSPTFAPPPGVAPPPPVSLTASPWVPGAEIRFTVAPLLPGEVAWIAWTRQPAGPGRCPAALGGVCLDVPGRHLLGPAIADFSASATLRHTFVNPAPPFGEVWAQAVVFRLDGTVAETAVVGGPLHDPARARVGDVVVTGTADLAALAGVTAITGDLVVDGAGLTTLDLPDLREIGGDLRVWDEPALTTLSLPALTAVGGDLSLYDDPALTGPLGLGALTRVGGALSVNRLPALTDLRGLEALREVGSVYLFHDTALASLAGLDGLERVGTSVELWELSALTEARLPALRTIGTRLDLFEVDALTVLALPALEALSAYELHQADAMADLGDFPALTALDALTLKYAAGPTSTDGFPALATLGALVVDRADGVQVVRLPALTTLGAAQLTGNAALAAIDLPALATLDAATITGNPALSQCAVDDWLGRLATPPLVTCGHNLDDGCAAFCAADTGGP